MSGSLFAAGLACFAAGALIDLVLGIDARLIRPVPYLFGLVGSGCLVVLGLHATTTTAVSVDLSMLFGVGHGGLHIDALSGLFLTLLFSVAVAVSSCFVSWSRSNGHPHRRGIATGYLLLLASTAVIVTAADAFLFLFSWELLTVSFYVLTSVTRSDQRQAGAAWATAGMGKLSGAALLFGFLLPSRGGPEA